MSYSFEMLSTEKFTVFSRIIPFEAPQTFSSPAPMTVLTHFISDGELNRLGAYLSTMNLFQAGEYDHGVFAAAGRKHADSIELQDRSGGGDEGATWPSSFGFKECRQRRGSAEFWRHNENSIKLPELVSFVERLPFFTSTGKVTIILSAKGHQGVEHVDHKFDDFVSEFVWIR